MGRIDLSVVLLCLAGCAGSGAGTGQPTGAGEDLLAIRQTAEASYTEKNYLESEKHYRVLAQRVPVEAENWFRLGNIYARTNRPDAAIAAYREALVRAPNNGKAWFNMAILQLGAAADSLAEMQKVADPADPLTERGAVLHRQLQSFIQSGAIPGGSESAPAGD